MKVRATSDAKEFWSLTNGLEYSVVGLDHDDFRVIDDTGEPILFPQSAFIVVDSEIPEDWIWNRYSDDEFYADPPGLHLPGFYEDYFDGREYAIERFVAYLRKIGEIEKRRLKRD